MVTRFAEQEKSWGSDELRDSSLLKGVDFSEVQGLLEDCPVRVLQPGEVLIEAGRKNREVFLILAGKLAIHLNRDLDSVAVIEAGQVVGELSVIDGRETSAWVLAQEPCRLLVLDEKNMWSLVNSCPQVALNLLIAVSERLRHGNELILEGQRLEQELEQLAVLDALTGLYNRRWAEHTLRQEIENSGDGRKPVSVLLIDIDDFGRFNDIYGHKAGDRVLFTVGRILRQAIGPDQKLARYDDEFMIFAPDKPADQLEELGTRLCRTVSETQFHHSDGTSLPPVTISIGAAQIAGDLTPQTCIATAASALELAKREGGNRARHTCPG